MIQLIKHMAVEAVDGSGPVQFLEAVVLTKPPELSIKLKSNAKLIIPKSLLVVAEHLTEHFKTGKVMSEAVESSLSLEGSGPHEHDITSLVLGEAIIEFKDELAVGDEVMVASIQGGQSFFIIDRTVSY